MTTLDTQLNARSADFQANAAAMRTLVDDLHVQLAKSAAGGGLGELHMKVVHQRAHGGSIGLEIGGTGVEF